MQYDNRNTGALFKNDKGGNERRPDYRGTINVNGTDYDLSAWLKSSKAGAKYMSLSVQPKRDNDRRPENRKTGNQNSQQGRSNNGFEDIDDASDIPF
jgi:hypothetical protein